MTCLETHTPTLQALLDEGDIDPRPYFEIVANNLLTRCGWHALRLATMATEQVRQAQDAESLVLWQGVRSVLMERLRGVSAEDGPVIH